MLNSGLDEALSHPEDRAQQSLFLEQQDINTSMLDDRVKSIQEIATSIMALSTIMRDIQTMVIDQGTLLDRIDFTIEQTHQNISAGHEELLKADESVRGAKAKWCIMILVCILGLLLIIAIFKPRRR